MDGRDPQLALLPEPDPFEHVPAHQRPRALTGEALKREGLRAAAEHEDQAGDWRRRALAAIAGLPAGHELTSEDLRRAVGDPEVANAMGAVFNTAATRGLIREVGSTKAKRPGLHATRLIVWERTEREA